MLGVMQDAWDQIGSKDTARKMNWLGMRSRQLPRRECGDVLEDVLCWIEGLALEGEERAVRELWESLAGWVIAFVPDSSPGVPQGALERALMGAGWIGDGGVLWAFGPEGEAVGDNGCMLRIGTGGVVAVARANVTDRDALVWASGLSEEVTGVRVADVERLEACWQTARLFC